MKNALDSLDGFKTLIFSVANIASLFVPGVAEWIAGNPEQYATILTAAYLLLRIFTKKPVANIGM